MDDTESKNNALEAYYDLVNDHPQIFLNKEAFIKIITEPSQIRDWQETRRKELYQNNLPLDWSDIGIVLDDPFVLMIRDLVEFPSGKLAGYIRMFNLADLKGGKGIAVLPYMDGKILLLHQFRHATRSWHLEIPRGFGEIGISPEDNARKEIEEETGGVIAELVDLGGYHSNTGIENTQVSLYFARLDTIGTPNEDEGIAHFRWVSSTELDMLIKDAQITDGFTIAAYVRAKLRSLF